eukprot:Skav205403  [mRNA]  locus=scaffold1642:421814:426305:- [translate_table: standard]
MGCRQGFLHKWDILRPGLVALGNPRRTKAAWTNPTVEGSPATPAEGLHCQVSSASTSKPLRPKAMASHPATAARKALRSARGRRP